MTPKPTESEILDKMAEAADAAQEGGNYPGMSYEEGVRDALQWVLGDIEELEV